MRPTGYFEVYLPVLLLAVSLLLAVAAPLPAAQQGNSSEMTTQEGTATFQSKVNLVLVPVVVRDGSGHAVGGLKQDDFALFDRGKPQTITVFTAHSRAVESVKVKEATVPGADGPGNNPSSTVTAPERFVIYLFDDLHIQFADLVNVQKAAIRHLNTVVQSGDRVAVFTTSGQNNLDFTDDRGQLENAIMKLRPKPMFSMGRQCPDVSYYMADLIVNKNDTQALQAATQEALICDSLDPKTQMTMAQQMAQSTAQQVLTVGEQDTRVSLSVIKDAVRRLSSMPGQRTMIIASPGFFAQTLEAVSSKADILDRAARANVMISALDARGLFTTNMDASQEGASSIAAQALISEYYREAAMSDSDVLAELADGTGGTFVHNTNDLNDGFARVAAAPEFYYMLGFSPQNMKPDGNYHRLKISLKEGHGLNIQARRGYYAPKHIGSAEETAKQDIEDAIFSREEMHDLTVDLHTQFFKPDPADAKLTVLARVDLRHLRFKKIDGRNVDQLKIVSVLFDRNGNYVNGLTKTVDMKLRDESLEKLSAGITVKANFDVKPGTYLIRLVVRDTEGQLMSAENGAINIP